MPKTRINYSAILLLSLVLFECGMVANAIGAVIPDAIRDLRLSYTTAALLPFTYFISYGFISIPAGILCERTSAKGVVVTSYILGFAGLISFALHPSYAIVLVSLFVIGCWLAAAQIPLFPLMRLAGGSENLAFFNSMTSVMYGAGSILIPHIYSELVQRLQSPEARGPTIRLFAYQVSGSYPWVSIYWLFSFVVLITTLVLFWAPLPQPKLTEEERAGTLPVYLALLKDRRVLIYAAGVFAYGACEQGTSNWLSQFLKSYHGLDPQTQGASILSWYWALLTLGCVAGILLLKLFDSRRLLFVSALLSAAAFSGAIFGSKAVSVVCFPLVGLFESVLWPIIIELALNSLEKHHGALMGILFTSITGAAFGPFVVGRLADTFGLRAGLTALYLPFLFMAYIGIWARPLVKNATIFRKTGMDVGPTIQEVPS
jgi:MFS transporter, FHS family, L-fucose permease